MMTFFPTHWRVFAIAWRIHAVRYAVANSASLPQTPNGTFVDRLSSKSRLPAWPPIFGSLHIGFRFPSNRESVSVRVLDRSLVTPAQDSLPDLPPSNGTSNPCAPFPRSKTRQDSTSPREVPRGVACRSCPAVSSACQARCGTLRCLAPRSRSNRLLSLRKLLMAHQSKSGTTQFALDISLDAKLRFESLHQSMGLRTKAQTFEAILYFVSTKDKIDPATLQRMEKKIDHSIHLLESLT
jgi:hypothetical protein